jgi:hypothetical protein
MASTQKPCPLPGLFRFAHLFRALIEAIIFLDRSERSSSALALSPPRLLTVSGLLAAAHASIASLIASRFFMSVSVRVSQDRGSNRVY